MALFALCQGLLMLKVREHPLELLVVTRQALQVLPGERHDPTHAPVHGLAGTLANECPTWLVRVVDLPLAPMAASPSLAPLAALPVGASGAWREGQWYCQVLREVNYCAAPPVYRKGGCYIIIGGAGGIGVAWTRRLIVDYQAQVYWIGRRPLDENIRADIERLASEGPAPIYLPADAGDPQALREALDWVHGQHAQVHGVIHAAMVMRGKSVQRMSRDEFSQVLAAKVATGAALEQALQRPPLDFLVFSPRSMPSSDRPIRATMQPGAVSSMNWAAIWRSTCLVRSPLSTGVTGRTQAHWPVRLRCKCYVRKQAPA
ncbi:SDR family NAD(P)-dependent oxidoreductase [Pseudomonas synxantha]|nr:SDR family NAD(P)-dependent oxidoreductase [Pseudomonas synxantha]